MTDYSYEDFFYDCYSFNTIAGKDKDAKLSDLKKQYELINEELKETYEALQQNNPKEVLDGVIDVMVTAIGFIQKLESLGINVQEAMGKTALNNLSKYPITEAVAIESAEMYDKQGIDVQVTYNSEYDVFVIKDENDKVRKPSNFVSNDLSPYIPESLSNGFEK